MGLGLGVGVGVGVGARVGQVRLGQVMFYLKIYPFFTCKGFLVSFICPLV